MYFHKPIFHGYTIPKRKLFYYYHEINSLFQNQSNQPAKARKYSIRSPLEDVGT